MKPVHIVIGLVVLILIAFLVIVARGNRKQVGTVTELTGTIIPTQAIITETIETGTPTPEALLKSPTISKKPTPSSKITPATSEPTLKQSY